MLAQLRERHALAIDGSGICLWDWDLVRDSVEFDGNWGPMLGYYGRRKPRTRRATPGIAPCIRTISRPRCIRSIVTARARHRSSRAKLAWAHKDGHWVSLLFRGSVNKRDQNGLALRISGTAIEISQLKQAMRQAEQSEALLKTVVDLLPQRVFWKDRDGHFLGANRNFKADVGVEDIDRQDRSGSAVGRRAAR